MTHLSQSSTASSRILIKACFASLCFVVLLTASVTLKYNQDAEFLQVLSFEEEDVSNKLHSSVKNEVMGPRAGDASRTENEIKVLEKIDQNRIRPNHYQYNSIPYMGKDTLSGFHHGRKLTWLESDNASQSDVKNMEPEAADNAQVHCDSLHGMNTSAVCTFVTTTPNCQNDQGFVSYIDIVYCNFDGRLLPLGVILLFFWWLFLFVGLAVTADDFFCPALKVISKTLRLSDNVAMFLAFGNGAPDIFSAIAAIGNAKNGDAGLAFGALFGAGVFVTSVVAGTIAIVCPFEAMQRPFLRDIIFYLAAVFWAFEVLWDKVIEQYEAIGFILLYVVYVITVIVGRYVYQRHKRYARDKLSKKVPTIQSDMDNNDPYQQSVDVEKDEDELTAPITGSASFFANRRPIRAQEDNDSSDDHREGEYTPLLGHGVSSGSSGGCVQFLRAINPIDVEGWKEKRFYSKLYQIFKLLLLLTIPVMEETADRRNWCRYLQSLQLVTGPVFAAMATKVGFKVLFGVLPVWALVLAIGVVLSVIVLCTSRNDTYPVYQPVFSFLGFLIAVVWIYCIANEVVNILQTFGVVFDISDAILGLTLLAWGNSVGDFIADTVMARQGYPRMGISACFGGPMFNLLLGIGIPFTIQIIEKGGSFKLQVTLEEYVLAGFLALSLIVSLVMVPCSRFRMSRPYGITLWVLYVIFLVVAILTEIGVIHAEV